MRCSLCAHSKLAGAIGIVVVGLLVTACGGSSKTAGQAATSQTTRVSSTESQGGASTQRARSTSQTSSSTQTQSTNPPPAAASEARARAARIAATRSMVRCLRDHGVQVPRQNPSAGFSTSGINTATKQYKQSYSTCLRAAIGIYRVRLRH